MFPASVKAIPLAVVLLLPWMLCAGEPQAWHTLKLVDGTEYRDARVTAVEPSGIKVMHASGVARIPFELLPDAVRRQFPYDEWKAAEHRMQLAAQEQAARIRIALEEAKAHEAAREQARRENLDYRYMVVKVARVLPDGLLCHRHDPGGVVGETGLVVRSLMQGRRCFSEPAQAAAMEPHTDYSTPLFVEGVKGECAEGDVLRGQAARVGVKVFEDRTLARWLAKPD